LAGNETTISDGERLPVFQAVLILAEASVNSIPVLAEMLDANFSSFGRNRVALSSDIKKAPTSERPKSSPI
jgi:hypothetical protein